MSLGCSLWVAFPKYIILNLYTYNIFAQSFAIYLFIYLFIYLLIYLLFFLDILSVCPVEAPGLVGNGSVLFCSYSLPQHGFC